MSVAITSSKSFFAGRSTSMRLALGTTVALGCSLVASLVAPTAASAQELVDRCGGAGSSASGAGGFCTKNIEYLSNGLAYWGLAICVIGVFVSAALWAMGSKGQNPGQELTGKKGFIVCFAGAFAIGAAVPVINFMNDQAKTVATPAGSNPSRLQPDTVNPGRSYNPWENEPGGNPYAGGANNQQPTRQPATNPAPNEGRVPSARTGESIND